MSVLGQKRTLRLVRLMSALPPKADIDEHDCHVRFVPKADIEYTVTGGNYVVAIAGIITRSGPRLGPPARI
jgi:hypothetical protein